MSECLETVGIGVSWGNEVLDFLLVIYFTKPSDGSVFNWSGLIFYLETTLEASPKLQNGACGE